MPVGAFGGRRDIMERLAPLGPGVPGRDPVRQPGVDGGRHHDAGTDVGARLPCAARRHDRRAGRGASRARPRSAGVPFAPITCAACSACSSRPSRGSTATPRSWPAISRASGVFSTPCWTTACISRRRPSRRDSCRRRIGGRHRRDGRGGGPGVRRMSVRRRAELSGTGRARIRLVLGLLLAALLVGAALAYPAFELVAAAGWPFHRVASRVAMLMLAVELVWLCRRLGLCSQARLRLRPALAPVPRAGAAAGAWSASPPPASGASFLLARGLRMPSPGFALERRRRIAASAAGRHRLRNRASR